MYTGYYFDFTDDGEIIFTKEKEEDNTPQQQLIEQISKSLNIDYEQTEFYARKWRVACLKEYIRGEKSGLRRFSNRTFR